MFQDGSMEMPLRPFGQEQRAAAASHHIHRKCDEAQERRDVVVVWIDPIRQWRIDANNFDLLRESSEPMTRGPQDTRLTWIPDAHVARRDDIYGQRIGTCIESQRTLRPRTTHHAH